MNGLPLWIIFGIFAAAGALISIAVAKRQLAHMNTAWQSAAETLGFSFEAGSMRNGPTISGMVDDRLAGVHSYTKSSGKSSNRYTRYTVEFPAVGVGLRLSRQAGLGQLLKILGTQDIVIGDPAFDEAFIVKSSDPRGVRAVLTPGRTMALNQLLAVHPEVVVTDDRIVIDRRGTVRDADVIVSTLRRVASVANLLADAGVSTELTSLIEQRLEGTLPADYEPEPELPQGIDARIATGEALAAFGVIDVAQKIFEALAVELPVDRDVVGWSEQTRQPIEQAQISAERTEVAAKTPVVDSAPLGDVNADAVAIATDLFGENRLSFETAALFDERYAGRRVAWSGKLRNAGMVDHYRVLGDGPFTKAVIDIAVLENDLFGNTVVTAIVAFPPGSIDSIQPGEDIAFSGKLVGIDALVRNLFVAEAKRET
jgi:predicted nucleic acid-binding protein